MLNYTAVHVALGFTAGLINFPLFNQLFLLYQLTQLITNKRVFLWEKEIKIGNSVTHTADKISYYMTGYFIGQQLLQIFKS